MTLFRKQLNIKYLDKNYNISIELHYFCIYNPSYIQNLNTTISC